ncbi:hypothetical protein [Desulfoscipio sp. XC116]|uniref:hypothetical protein n=1 Tax=Desulfoscipio sp. XC116 TaxID=3144975 RepID=UPI00325B9768
MDIRIKELIDLTKAKFGLDDYYLHTHRLRRSINIYNNPVYTLCMEWFPGHATKQENDDYNPAGTAVVDIDINSRQFKSIIFVGGKSFANGIVFPNSNTNALIKWIEQETGLAYGEQFQLVREKKGELFFQERIYGIAASPAGYIEINLDQEGKLTLFSVNGHFPSKDLIIKETYSLTLEKVEQLTKEQLKFVELPSLEKKRFIPVYAIEEIFVTNDQTSTIPFKLNTDIKSDLTIEKVMRWKTPVNKPFKRTEISFIEDVKPDQTFLCESHPDTLPITPIEQDQCIMAVENFLRQVFPQDTGKWILKTLHRENGYIHALLKQNKTDNCVFQRKLIIFLDAINIQVLNYMDTKPFLEIFKDFEKPEKTTLNKDEAYEKIRALIELTPVYVYNFKQKKYSLCGKIDCHYGVHAARGQAVLLDDL